MAEQKIRDWRRAAREKVHGYPEIKRKTKDATNSDLWGPTDAQKSEIAEASFNEENRTLVLKALWKRVDDKTEYWMHVYKGLDVLEYMLLVDVPGVFNDLRFHHQMINQLQQYSYAVHKEEREKEKLNEKVRLKASRLLNLMSDGEVLLSERQKLRLIMARITGVSEAELNLGGGTPTTSPMPHEAPHTKKTKKSAGGATAVERDLGGGRPSANQQAGDEFELDMDVMLQVMDMGFTDQDAVLTAMMAADNNLERAVQYLVNNPTPEPQATTGGNSTAGATNTNVHHESPVNAGGGGDLFASAPTTQQPEQTHTAPAEPEQQRQPSSTIHQQPVVDIFNPPTVTLAPSGSHETGLWKLEAEQPKPAPPVATAVNGGGGFDPFAVAAPPTTEPVAKSDGLQDFFAHHTTPQEVTKRGGMPGGTPPTQQGGGDLVGDLFGPGPTTTATDNKQQQQQQQPSVDLFGAPTGAANSTTRTTVQQPPSQTDLFGGGGGFAPTTTNAAVPYNNTAAARTNSTTSTTSSSTGAGGAKAPELTLQQKMMMEFQGMGKPAGQAKKAPATGNNSTSLDQLMLGGQTYGSPK